MYNSIFEISVSKEFDRYKRLLDLNTKEGKRIDTLLKTTRCAHCKSIISSGEECLVLRDKKGKIIKVFCKECVLNALKLHKAAVAMENLPYDDDMEEIKRTNDLIELVKLFLNPIQRSDELNGTIQEEGSKYHTTVISLVNLDNSGKRWRRKGTRR